MELKQYLVVVWKWWWLIVLSTAIAAGSSYLATRSQPRIYASATTLMVGQNIQSTNPDPNALYTSERLATTYAEIARRAPVLQGTIDALGLATTPAELLERTSIRLIPQTQLMEIKVLDTSPERARIIADEMARQLILQSPTGPTDSKQNEQRRFIETQLIELRTKIEAAQEGLLDLQQELDAANSARRIADLQAQQAAIQTKITAWQASYASLLQSYKGSVTNYLTVVEPATLSLTPVSPNVPMNVLLAATIGLVLAVGGAFLIEYLDDTIKTGEDADRVLGLPSLGAIARIVPIKTPADALITHNEPKSPIAEAYRVLRTNLQFAALNNPATAILITSAGPREGKTTTLANLGVVMAQTGKKVILVDTDLRRPTLHKLFELPNRDGLTNLMLQESPDVTSLLQATAIPNLFVLTSGPIPPNPAEILASPRLDAIITQLKQRADTLLFDSPPVLAVADATILAGKIKEVMLVVDAGVTRSEVCRRGKEALTQTGAKLLGVALNRLRTGRSGDYYYYYYYYSSSDGTTERRRHHRPWWQRLWRKGG